MNPIFHFELLIADEHNLSGAKLATDFVSLYSFLNTLNTKRDDKLYICDIRQHLQHAWSKTFSIFLLFSSKNEMVSIWGDISIEKYSLVPLPDEPGSQVTGRSGIPLLQLCHENMKLFPPLSDLIRPGKNECWVWYRLLYNAGFIRGHRGSYLQGPVGL